MAKILACDDEHDILEMLKEALELEGHKVVTASSGKECIKKAIEIKPPS